VILLQLTIALCAIYTFKFSLFLSQKIFSPSLWLYVVVIYCHIIFCVPFSASVLLCLRI